MVSSRDNYFMRFFLLFAAALAGVSTFAASSAAANATPTVFCSNASGAMNGGNLFSLMAMSACDAGFECLTTFCLCAEGSNLTSTSCITNNTSVATLASCMATRVHCTIQAALSSVSSADSTCASWANRLVEDYEMWRVNTSASNLTAVCAMDVCPEVPSALAGLFDVGAACMDFSPNFTTAAPTTTVALTTTAAPENTTVAPATTTTAPTPTPKAPIDVVPAATSVRLTFSGSKWSVVLTNNRSALAAVVQSTIAAAINESDVSKINITSMSVGSLIVLFTVQGLSSDAAANTALARTVSSGINVASLNTFYQAAAQTNESTSFAGASVVTSNPGTGLGHASSCGAACIGAVAGGCVLGVALVVGLIFLCRAKCRNVDKRSTQHFSTMNGGQEMAPRCPTASAANGQVFGRLR